MAKQSKFTLVFAPEAIAHLDGIESKHLSVLRDSIKEQLTFTPADETRNRKPLNQPAPFDATWEIRYGPDNRFRVFYEIDDVAHEVHILAIGLKDRNRLLFEGEEYET